MDRKIDSPFWLEEGWESFESGWEQLDKTFIAGIEAEGLEVEEAKLPCESCFKKPFDPELAKIEHTLNLVEVEFKSMRRDFFINEQNLDLKPGDYVLVEALRGVDLGRVHLVGEKVHQKRNFLGIVGQLMRKVIRLANEDDLNKLRKNREDEIKAYYIFKQRVKVFNLEMKLIDVEYQFDRNRLTFYFTAGGRVDFRAFVRDLAKIFKTRIELWQIGVRDEARKIGGIGSCGRALCCNTWLEKFNKVTLIHAKFQNLPLNPIKLSGQCGRLKCCLLFEMETYLDALRNFPPIDYEIQTERGIGKIEKFDIFKNYVYVHYGNDLWERYTLEEIKKIVPPEAFERNKEIFSNGLG